MKLRLLFASSLSLSLMACSQISPVSRPVQTQAQSGFNAPVNLPAAARPTLANPAPAARLAKLQPGSFEGQVTQTGNHERIQLRFKSGLRTQLAEVGRLAFVKLTVQGQGLSGSITQDGNEYVSVHAGEASATFSNLPISNGGVRVVTAQGYDADFNLLPAFKASGYYVSRRGDTSISLSLGRRWSLLGDLIAYLLGNNTALLEMLDLASLQTRLEAAQGFDPITGNFVNQPSQYDIALLAGLLAENPTASANAINDEALLDTGNAHILLTTFNDVPIGEDLILVVDDPSSRPLGVPFGTASGASFDIRGISPGNWNLEVRKADGTVLFSQSVDGSLNNNSAFGMGDRISVAPALSLPIEVPHGGFTNEDLVFRVSDPYHQAVPLASGARSGDSVNLGLVSNASQWTVGAYTLSGELLASTTVSVNLDGTYSFGSSPLVLTGVSERQDEFRVHTFTENDQEQAQTAMDDEGNFVVVWRSQGQTGQGEDIFAQRFDSSGQALGTEFRVNTVTAGDQTEPSIAMNADGDFAISWTSDGNPDSNGSEVFAKRYDAAGAEILTNGEYEFRVNETTGSYQRDSSIAMSGDGEMVIAWESLSQEGNPDFGIFAKRYDAAGNVVLTDGVSEFHVNVSTVLNQLDSDVSMDDIGNFVVTWISDSQDGDNYGIYGRRYNAAGVTQLTGGVSEFQINSFVDGLQDHQDVAMDSDGDFVVVWRSMGQDGSGSGVYGKRYNSSGNVVTTGGQNEFLVSEITNDNQQEPTVASDGDGNFTVAWTTYENGSTLNEIAARRYASSGSSLLTDGTAEFRVNSFPTSYQNEPNIGMNSGGNFVVIWQSSDQDEYGNGVYAKRYNSEGESQ